MIWVDNAALGDLIVAVFVQRDSKNHARTTSYTSYSHCLQVKKGVAAWMWRPFVDVQGVCNVCSTYAEGRVFSSGFLLAYAGFSGNADSDTCSIVGKPCDN